MLDCTRGTSGSPVITKLKNLMETTGPGKMEGRLRFVLLGVNSSTGPLPKYEEPLGLTAVVFSPIVQHITKDSITKDMFSRFFILGKRFLLFGVSLFTIAIFSFCF
jgi:hypothetical protein